MISKWQHQTRLVVDDESNDSDNPPIEQTKSKWLGKFLTKTINISFNTAENQEWLKLIVIEAWV